MRGALYDLHLCFIELNMNMPQYQLDNIDPSDLRKVADQYEIFYTIHLDENLNVSDFNPYIADGYRRTVAETIMLAKSLGVPIVNLHLSRGVYFTLPDQKVYLFSVYKEQYLKSIMDFRMMCENAISNANIMICIENCDGYLAFQKEAIDILLESPVFGLTFDIGHSHSCGGSDETYMIENQTHLHHMHMHDALKQSCHLALGTGTLDLAKYLALAKAQNCRIVLETKTIEGLKLSVDWIRNRGFA